VVYTSNVFALLGMRSLYFLLAGAASRLRYLRPGLAVILAVVAIKLLLADVWELPAWSTPAFIVAVLAIVVVAGLSDRRAAAASAPHDQARAAAPAGSRPADGPRRASAAAPPAARR
jgi:tellurite resistance protein TerC